MDQIESIQEIYNICKKFEEMRLFAKKIPFNNSEMQFMKHILIANEKGEKIFSSEIAKRIGITRSAVSQMVQKLEDKGLVVRVSDGKDRKKIYIELSEKALAYYRKLKEQTDFFFSKLVEKIGERQMENFIKVAKIFLEALKDVKCEYNEKNADI